MTRSRRNAARATVASSASRSHRVAVTVAMAVLAGCAFVFLYNLCLLEVST